MSVITTKEPRSAYESLRWAVNRQDDIERARYPADRAAGFLAKHGPEAIERSHEYQEALRQNNLRIAALPASQRGRGEFAWIESKTVRIG